MRRAQHEQRGYAGRYRFSLREDDQFLPPCCDAYVVRILALLWFHDIRLFRRFCVWNSFLCWWHLKEMFQVKFNLNSVWNLSRFIDRCQDSWGYLSLSFWQLTSQKSRAGFLSRSLESSKDEFSSDVMPGEFVMNIELPLNTGREVSSSLRSRGGEFTWWG